MGQSTGRLADRSPGLDRVSAMTSVPIRGEKGRPQPFELIESFSGFCDLWELFYTGLAPGLVFSMIADRARQIIRAERSCYIGVDPVGENGELEASFGQPDALNLRIQLRHYPEVRKAIETGHPVVVQRVDSDPIMARVRKSVLAAGISSIQVVPVILGDPGHGALCWKRGRSEPGFTLEETRFCQAISKISASFLRSASRLRRASEENSSLREKNEARLKYFAMAVHELKTPLSVATGYIRSIEQGKFGPVADVQQAAVKEVSGTLEQISSLIWNLLDSGRFAPEFGRPSLQLNSFRELLDKVSSRLKLLFEEKGLRLKIMVPEGPLSCFFDREGIQRVLTNLLDNAIKFSPRGGVVTVLAAAVGGSGTSREPRCLRVGVTDQGPKLPEEIRGEIFSEFFRGPIAILETQGAGLGLAIAKQIVDAHGGRIWMENRKGPGKTFTFTLPWDKGPDRENVAG